MPEPPGWSLLPLVLVRGTGFPVELLDAVRTPETVEAADRYRALRERLADRRREFLDTAFEKVVAGESAAGATREQFKEWYRVRRRIDRTSAVLPVPAVLDRAPVAKEFVRAWNALVSDVDEACARLTETGAREGAEAWRRLAGIAAGERFREAVFLSSPGMHRALDRHLAKDRPERDHRTSTQLYGYLQRFTTKNETTSFFGPIDHAVVRPGQPDRLRLDVGAGRIRGRRTRLAFWAVQALADAVAASEEVRPHLTSRLADAYRTDADGVVHAISGRRPHLSAAERRVFELSDGGHRVGELDPEPLASLVHRGLVEVRPRPPTALDDPVAWLRGWIRTAPWLDTVDSLDGLAARFADAPVEEKARILAEAQRVFETATGTAASRAGGLYTDRSLLYDEALGDLTINIGPSMVEDLADRLRPALDLCASYSLVLQAVVRERARDVALRMGGGAPVPYLAFVRELLARVDPAACRDDERVTSFLDGLATVARGARASQHARAGRAGVGAGQHVQLDPAPLLRPIPAGTCVSPDIFLAATGPDTLVAGDYDLIIGEVHHGVQIWTHLLAFWPDVDALGAELAARMPGPDLADTVYQRRQGKAFPRELPGFAIEFGGRSTKPADRILRAADLDVVPTEDGVALRSAGRVLRLHPGDPRAAANWVFGLPPVLAPPIRLGTHTPRIRVGGAAFQRETWHLDGAAFTPAREARSPAEALALVRDLADRAGLPTRWFAKVDGARKPFHVDLDSLPSVQYVLANADPARRMRCTELLPGPEHWWLPAHGGGRRGAEWRTTWVYQGAS